MDEDLRAAIQAEHGDFISGVQAKLQREGLMQQLTNVPMPDGARHLLVITPAGWSVIPPNDEP